MRTVRRLRLRYFLLFTSLLMCCPLCYSLPCRNQSPPSKAHISRYYFTTIICTIALFQVRSDVCAFGGGGENRTPVQDLFHFTSYSNNSYLFTLNNSLIRFFLSSVVIPNSKRSRMSLTQCNLPVL